MIKSYFLRKIIKSRLNRLPQINLANICITPLNVNQSNNKHDYELMRNNWKSNTYQKFKQKNIEDVIKPLAFKSVPKKFEPEHIDGLEFLDGSQISSILDDFVRRPTIRQLCLENGLSEKIFMATFKSFRNICITDENLDITIRLNLSDIHNKKASPDILLDAFLRHSRQIYPHLDSMEELKYNSDLTQPHNWYPVARKIFRKIIFHAGPTNSGKTHAALERFKSAKTGIYCGPLRLLAHEIYDKTIANGIECDLITGEDRRYAIDRLNPAGHTSCTVEMLSVDRPVEVAVIDEIQMIRDEQRGHSFTRALLGVPAEEVHLCGELAAYDIIKKMLDPIGEHVEIIKYDRKSPLKICDYALEKISNVQKGDAIICFSREAIFNYARRFRLMKIPSAIIYGKLPPKTKLAQAAKFNDPNDPTKVLLATDAIGMGINLNIGRVIFHSLNKGTDGMIKNHVALQIAGRAGRFGSCFEEGKVLTVKNKDLKNLKELMEKPIENISKAGIAPTFEQIETFSYHLPTAKLTNILDIFSSICSVSDTYFLCDFESVRDLALLIDPIKLPIRDKYTFCCSPLSPKTTFLSVSFVKIARKFSSGQPITYQWLCDLIKYPFNEIKSSKDIDTLLDKYDLIIFYLWSSYRFPEMFPDYLEVKELEKEVDRLIQNGISMLSS
uniref:RNA helicase n=1 Tax=Strongyloides venezuelensis TaxID=75913 RepID=A0A0K0F6K7_STRVS